MPFWREVLVEAIIKKRFEELAAKGERVVATRTFDFQADDGTRYFKISDPHFTEWTTNVLNLLVRVMGAESIHYKRFTEESNPPQSYGLHESSYHKARSIFDAAREDYEGGYLFNVRSLVAAEVFEDAI